MPAVIGSSSGKVELSGIPERELNKLKQNEECLEITSYMDDVRALSHMNDHLSNHRYVRTHGASPADKSDDFCVIDMSTGWTPATNVKEGIPRTTQQTQRF